jgi:K+-sensing histidine kinase KdpD
MANLMWIFVCAAILVVAIMREVQSRRAVARLEQKLATTQAQLGARNDLADVGQLVSGIAQDLKSPLQSVIGNTELMIASAGEGESSEELQNIRDDATRAAGIVRNLLAFTETAALSRRWQDVNDIVAHAIERCRADRKVQPEQVQLNCAERLPLVYVDGRQLERVVATFLGCTELSDALGVTRLAITTRRIEPGGDRLGICIDEDASTLASEDDAAWSAELAACHRVMEAHGGSIAVERKEGGVRVTLELPTAAGATGSG